MIPYKKTEEDPLNSISRGDVFAPLSVFLWKIS